MPNFMMLHTFAPGPVFAHPVSAIPPAEAAPVVAPRPVLVSPVIATSATHSTINPGLIYMRNPILGGWFLGAAQPRTIFSLPTLISPVAAPTDQTIFEEPQDGTKKHYLPQYGIATRGSGGSLQRWVTFAPTSAGFALTVHLTDTTPAALSAGNAPVAVTTARYLLTANLQGQAMSWDFDTATADGSNLVLAMTITDPATRDSIYRAMTDPTAQAKLILRRSFSIAAPAPPAPNAPATAQPLYRATTTAIDSTLPFTFDATLDKNVFAGLSNIGSGQPSWNIQQVSWQGRSYPYYQDLNQPSQIYFLPDSFKIGRQEAVPHAPSIVVSTNGNDPNSLTFTLTFLAVPVWDHNRLNAAAQTLQTTLGLAALPTLSLFEATTTALSLTVPPADPTAAPGLTPQPGANIDIAAGIKCSLALSMAQFQQVYAALFEQVTQLLSGVVTVTVDADVEQIPFISSAADFAGEIFQSTTSFDPTKNQLTVVLENGIESPIHVASLPAVLVKAGQPVPSVTQQLTPAPPLDLRPSSATASTPDTLTVAMQLGAGQSIDSTCTVQFDYSNTQVNPDPAAIWAAIMQNQVVAPVKRQIQILVFSSIFAPAPAPVAPAAPVAAAAPVPVTAGATPADASAAPASASATTTPAPQIMAVQVVFDDGQTANFDPSTTAVNGVMTQTVALSVPIEAYVLQSGDTSSYTYRVDLITSAGTTQGDPVTSNQDSFYVQVPA